MKKILLFASLIACLSAFSQKVLEENVPYTETRLPLKPLGTALKAYSFTVTTPYPENNNSVKEFAQKKHEEALANYPAVVEQSKAEYAERLKKHDEDVKAAQEKFKLENEAFDKMTLVERLAQKDKKPVLRLPSKPEYYKPSEPRYVEPDLSKAIVYDRKMLANSYLNLDGYQRGEANALIGKVDIYNFEYLEPIQKYRDESYYDKNTGKTMTRKVSYYVTSYKRSANLSLEFNGQSLYNNIFEGSGNFIELETPSYPNLLTLEKKTMDDILTAINAYINSNYGLTVVQKTAVVSYVKNKDELYDDLEKAKDLAISGYKANTFGTVNTDLTDAISIWNKAIQEADPEDRKARIDEKVLRVILINCIEAAMTVNDYATAEKHIKTYESLKNSSSEKKTIGDLRDIYADKNKRFKANQ